MLCVRCDDNKISYSGENAVDIPYGMILVKNLALGLSSMGAGDLCTALKRSFVTAVGRVIEAPSGSGRDLVGRSIFYRPKISGETLCTFSPGDPVEAIEVGVDDSQAIDCIVSMETQLALRYSKISGPSPLVIGGGFEAYVALYILSSGGVRAATIGRIFRGVETLSLSVDSAADRSYSSVYIAGMASEDEKKILRILVSRGGIDIYYHPLLAGEEISIPLGNRIRIRSLRYSRPGARALELSKRIRRAARGYKYLETGSDEEPPLYTDYLILVMSS